MTVPVIRRFREEDAGEVSAVICRTLRVSNTPDYGCDYIENTIKHFTPELVLERAGWTHFYVVCLEEKIVGCGAIGPYWGRENESALFNIFVLPQCQGLGLGKKLIAALERDEYFTRARRIEIAASITACQFYRALGYDYKNGIDTPDEERLFRLEKWNQKEEQTMYSYTKVRGNIWQIQEDEGVCCTLVRGEKMALLVDTGYGRRNLRSFVEAHITTPYMVVNTHGHPDHIGGNHWFDSVSISPEDMDTLRFFDEGEKKSCPLKALEAGTVLDLGGYHVEVLSLTGHTRGSLGLLVKEERLLLAGDAMNDWLWLFHYGSLPMQVLRDSLKRALTWEFDTYLGGHSATEYTKDLIRAHIHNIETLNPEECPQGETMGFDTRTSQRDWNGTRSVITFTEDKLQGAKG